MAVPTMVRFLTETLKHNSRILLEMVGASRNDSRRLSAD